MNPRRTLESDFDEYETETHRVKDYLHFVFILCRLLVLSIPPSLPRQIRNGFSI